MRGGRKYRRFEKEYVNEMWRMEYVRIGWDSVTGRAVESLSVIDGRSRMMLTADVGMTAAADYVVRILEEAIGVYGKPRAILSDHGTQRCGSNGEAPDPTNGADGTGQSTTWGASGNPPPGGRWNATTAVSSRGRPARNRDRPGVSRYRQKIRQILQRGTSPLGTGPRNPSESVSGTREIPRNRHRTTVMSPTRIVRIGGRYGAMPVFRRGPEVHRPHGARSRGTGTGNPPRNKHLSSYFRFLFEEVFLYLFHLFILVRLTLFDTIYVIEPKNFKGNRISVFKVTELERTNMAKQDSLKMPDEYTEMSYEDGDLSGSGHRHWDKKDTSTVAKIGLGVGTIIGIGFAIKYRHQIGAGISYAWNMITGCCSPNHESDNVPVISNNLGDNNYSNDVDDGNNLNTIPSTFRNESNEAPGSNQFNENVNTDSQKEQFFADNGNAAGIKVIIDLTNNAYNKQDYFETRENLEILENAGINTEVLKEKVYPKQYENFNSNNINTDYDNIKVDSNNLHTDYGKPIESRTILRPEEYNHYNRNVSIGFDPDEWEQSKDDGLWRRIDTVKNNNNNINNNDLENIDNDLWDQQEKSDQIRREESQAKHVDLMVSQIQENYRNGAYGSVYTQIGTIEALGGKYKDLAQELRSQYPNQDQNNIINAYSNNINTDSNNVNSNNIIDSNNVNSNNIIDSSNNIIDSNNVNSNNIIDSNNMNSNNVNSNDDNIMSLDQYEWNVRNNHVNFNAEDWEKGEGGLYRRIVENNNNNNENESDDIYTRLVDQHERENYDPSHTYDEFSKDKFVQNTIQDMENNYKEGNMLLVRSQISSIQLMGGKYSEMADNLKTKYTDQYNGERVVLR